MSRRRGGEGCVCECMGRCEVHVCECVCVGGGGGEREAARRRYVIFRLFPTNTHPYSLRKKSVSVVRQRRPG